MRPCSVRRRLLATAAAVVTSAVVTGAVPAAALAATAPPAVAVPAGVPAATGPVVINEVESSGTTPDFVELTNTGTASVDISGYRLLDDDDTHDPLTIPAGTTLAAGAFAAFDTDPPFGLGSSDTARLFAADGTTLLDSYSWTTHAATTYGRCPDGTGAFTTTAAPTRGAANACAPAPGAPVRTDAAPWPGPQQVTVADAEGALGEDQSGLAYEAADGNRFGVLWSVQNDPGVLWRLVWNGAIWTPDTANGWAHGKQLRYPDGTGRPDSEGVTLVGGSSATGVFVSTERGGDHDDASRPAILRFDVSGTDDELVATAEWDMTADLPTIDPNEGFEAITWLPDDGVGNATDPLVTADGSPYDPASYGDHFGGVFFAGLEANGEVYAYVLDEAGTTFTRIASFSSGFPTVMELQAVPDLGLRAICDDTCEGQQTLLTLRGGTFVVTGAVARPTGLPDVNDEGFVQLPPSVCVDGVAPAFWADDDGTDGHALRRGGVPCAEPVGGSSSPTAPAPVPSSGPAPLAATGVATGAPLLAGLAAVAVGTLLVAAGARRRGGVPRRR